MLFILKSYVTKQLLQVFQEVQNYNGSTAQSLCFLEPTLTSVLVPSDPMVHYSSITWAIVSVSAAESLAGFFTLLLLGLITNSH